MKRWRKRKEEMKDKEIILGEVFSGGLEALCSCLPASSPSPARGR